MLLTKDAILKADDLPFEDVDVPEWGGIIRVRTLTGTERDQLEAAMLQTKDSKQVNMDNLRARLVALTAINEKGDRLFDLKDITALGKKSSNALGKIFTVAQKLSGIGVDDVEDLTKNSTGGQKGSSTSV